MEKALAIQKQVIEILGTDEVYLVGGSVRDIVMGNEPKDYDFTTPMLPEDIEARVEAAGRHAYGIGKKFGTIGFKVKVTEYQTIESSYYENLVMSSKSEGVGDYVTETEVVGSEEYYEYVEVTTFRSEVYTSKSRKPEVEFVASLDEDLARRDFTMNAMVLRPDGTIYDPYGGKLHIHKKHIVTVGMPKDRIQEDPLRMLRAARFAARYGFTIDPNFIGKARQLADRIYDVSVERWVQELDKLFTSHYIDSGLDALEQMALWSRILPEVPIELTKAPDIVAGDADNAWREILQDSHWNKGSVRYVNTGICARLKFSNDRTSIIIDRQP